MCPETGADWGALGRPSEALEALEPLRSWTDPRLSRIRPINGQRGPGNGHCLKKVTPLPASGPRPAGYRPASGMSPKVWPKSGHILVTMRRVPAEHNAPLPDRSLQNLCPPRLIWTRPSASRIPSSLVLSSPCWFAEALNGDMDETAADEDNEGIKEEGR